MAHLICGYYEESVEEFLAAYALLKSPVSNLQCLAICCERLGHLLAGHRREASGYLMEAISAYDSIGDRAGRAFSLHRRAELIYVEDPSLAYQLMADARQLFMSGESYNASEIFCTANSLASWAQQAGNHHLAMRLLREGSERTKALPQLRITTIGFAPIANCLRWSSRICQFRKPVHISC